jgi:hypothetical protein
MDIKKLLADNDRLRTDNEALKVEMELMIAGHQAEVNHLKRQLAEVAAERDALRWGKENPPADWKEDEQPNIYQRDYAELQKIQNLLQSELYRSREETEHLRLRHQKSESARLWLLDTLCKAGKNNGMLTLDQIAMLTGQATVEGCYDAFIAGLKEGLDHCGVKATFFFFEEKAQQYLYRQEQLAKYSTNEAKSARLEAVEFLREKHPDLSSEGNLSLAEIEAQHKAGNSITGAEYIRMITGDKGN